ncbi:MAG TPA: class I SAM-dependent methyltransferase [Candidatus Avipropionibacterium avicola]|uniref:Class I SAM-dependent methyltransferase n=1 Tax=Candidatus Avipropionibacterium avicola TaxID=2840701 RepID=A0A9D1H0L8_9ACTN|nr:class I SAM-dependent methyltransferase [Candidatus Avipropionibacterium avicola]
MEQRWFDDNAANWDQRAAVHAGSPGYGLQGYLDDPARISATVAFDRPDLGALDGVQGIHLQCHLGTDTISLARLGATMIGLDLSPESVAVANQLAERTGDDARFVASNVYDAPAALAEAGRSLQYDLVYTGGGALCWLPDIAAWARVCAELLAPGGVLHVRDFHPVMLALADDRDDDLLVLDLPYFETREPMTWDDGLTYVAGGADAPEITATTNHQWNHGIAETVTAVMAAGLQLELLREDRTSGWARMGEAMVEVPGLEHEYELADRPERLPATFTLRARRPL